MKAKQTGYLFLSIFKISPAPPLRPSSWSMATWGETTGGEKCDPREARWDRAPQSGALAPRCPGRSGGAVRRRGFARAPGSRPRTRAEPEGRGAPRTWPPRARSCLPGALAPAGAAPSARRAFGHRAGRLSALRTPQSPRVARTGVLQRLPEGLQSRPAGSPRTSQLRSLPPIPSKALLPQVPNSRSWRAPSFSAYGPHPAPNLAHPYLVLSSDRPPRLEFC